MMSPLGIFAISLYLTFVMAEYISFEPVKYDLPDPPKLIVNRKLTEAQILFADIGLKGLTVQTLVIHQDKIFTAAQDGWVRVIENGNIRRIASISSNEICVPGEVVDVTLCGEPTGMVMGPNGVDIYIADAYIGVTIINSITGERDVMFAIGTPVKGVPTKMFTDIAIKSNGDVYVCEANTKWPYYKPMTILLESGNHGRVVRIRRRNTRVKTSVFLDGMSFCAGISMTRDERSILVAEFLRGRILRHYISGRKNGKTVTFADNLPGFPENIRPSSGGGYWVAASAIRNQHIFDVIDTLPGFRSIMREHLTDATIFALLGNRGMIMEISAKGKVLRTLQDLTAEKIGIITQANEKDGILYISSYVTPGVAELNLND